MKEEIIKNNKKAIILALAVSIFIIPVGNDTFVAETITAEVSDPGVGIPSSNNTEENNAEENYKSLTIEEENSDESIVKTV